MLHILKGVRILGYPVIETGLRAEQSQQSNQWASATCVGPLRVAHRFAFPVKQSVSAAEPSTIANGFQETRCETSTQIKTQQEQPELNNAGGIFLSFYDSRGPVASKDPQLRTPKKKFLGCGNLFIILSFQCMLLSNFSTTMSSITSPLNLSNPYLDGSLTLL